MYLHEQRLAQAIKRLYMLGNKPYDGRGFSAGLQGVGAAATQGMQDIKRHEAAKNVQLGGYDTAEGAETKARSSEAKAQDLNTGRKLMYMGGLMNTGPVGPGMGPGNF